MASLERDAVGTIVEEVLPAYFSLFRRVREELLCPGALESGDGGIPLLGLLLQS